ncbi:MAG: hypothetical protein ACREEC_11960 [Thermoplasmata archaeon]
MLAPSALAPCKRVSPVISLLALEPRAGSTTIAFNLAVQVAVAGVQGDRRPRPVCLLRDGEQTAAIGLDPQALASYFRSHPVSADEEVVELAVRHPTGCELFCIGDGGLSGQQLRLLLPVLRRFYDLIVIDCPTDDHWLREVAVDASDATLLVGLPSSDSASAASAWADRAWERGIVGKMAVVTNRVQAGQRLPDGLGSGLQNQISIPEDRLVASHDRQGLPWVIRFESSARVAADELSRQLVPQLMGQRVGHAA